MGIEHRHKNPLTTLEKLLSSGLLMRDELDGSTIRLAPFGKAFEITGRFNLSWR